MNYKTPFAAIMLPYQKMYNLPVLFEDFLNLCLCILTPSAIAGLPWDRERFEHLLDKYSDPSCTLNFVQAFNCLLQEIPSIGILSASTTFSEISTKSISLAMTLITLLLHGIWMSIPSVAQPLSPYLLGIEIIAKRESF